MLKNIHKQLFFSSLVLIGVMGNTMTANAFTWTFGAGSTTDFPEAVMGSFDIDDEDLGAGATVNNINITIGATNLTDGNLQAPPPLNPFITAGGGGINVIDFDFGGSGLLTLRFNTSLTTSGGTVTLDNLTSDFDGSAVSGTMSASSTNIIPFNFSTTPGLVVLGLITGVAKGRKHLPKIKEKLKELLTKK